MELLSENFATKTEMTILKEEMKSEFRDVRNEMRSEFKEVRSEMRLLESRIVLKLGSLIVIVAGLMTTLSKIL